MADLIRRRRGAVLIIVLLALFGLALLGTSMLLFTSLDRSVTVNYLDQIRAGRLARSGVAAATAALSAEPFDPNLHYWGDDETEDPKVSRRGGVSPQDVPLDFARNPSLAVEKDGDPTAGSAETRKYTVAQADGRTETFGVSGIHTGSTYGNESDVYQVRITDTSSCLHLNDGAGQHGGNQSSVSQNLKRMLNVLGNLPTVNVPHLGDRVLGARPPDGFGSFTDLERHFTRDELIRIRPFVATNAWVDKNVANPVPLSVAVAGAYPVKYYRGPGLFRRGRGTSSSGHFTGVPLRWFDALSTDPGHCAIYGLDELNPSYIEIVHRAPVNINTARREVLIALLSGLHGFFVGERRAFAPYCPSRTTADQKGVEIPKKYYGWWTVNHTYDEKGLDGDEYGFIYATHPIEPVSNTRATSVQSASAATIADHIIACRERRGIGMISYGDDWFGGPFRTWTQFNRFVDSLVENEIIKDNRPIFYDYSSDVWEGLDTQESKAGQKFASYAIADVIKANFNPNLHLNELNPDANLYLRVDKTDLIVNSTEFSFMPTGVYEIESIGRVLRPQAGTGTRSSSSLFTIEAQRRLHAAVRVFEPYRETSQRHFAAGRMLEKETDLPTNSGFALESGPEPDVQTRVYVDNYGGFSSRASFDEDGHRGYSPGNYSRPTGWGYEFDGYLALSTYGGHDHRGRDKDVCRPHWPVESAKDSEGMHVHFSKGLAADFNSGLPLEEQAQTSESGPEIDPRRTRNFGDAPGDPGGPLWITNGAKGAHRLARSFRLPLRGTPEPPPALLGFAPGDLRTDGFYSERHSGAAYTMRQARPTMGLESGKPGNFTLHGGVLSLWVKPSFFPEHTGKARNIVSMSKYHKNGPYRSPAPFNLMFMPAHDKPGYEEPASDELGNWAGAALADPHDQSRVHGGPKAPLCEYRHSAGNPGLGGNIANAAAGVPSEKRKNGFGPWQFRPASFMAFRAATSADAGYTSGGYTEGQNTPPDIVDIENYAVTSCLNHNLHPHGLDSGSTPRAKAEPESMRPNYFEAHRWTHVLMSWQVLPPW